MRDRWEEIKEERIRDRRKERRRLQQEIALYIGILKLIAIAMLILIGIATLNRVDAVMAGQDNLSVKIDRLSEEISQANTLYPVSYTHLDVYKRQVYGLDFKDINFG